MRAGPLAASVILEQVIEPFRKRDSRDSRGPLTVDLVTAVCGTIPFYVELNIGSVS